MPRFVIQQHDRQGEPTHWDFMLEQGDALKTFRLDSPPAEWLSHPARATPIWDHPARFLSYEGPVNRGLGRVKIAEKGIYETLVQHQNSWEVELEGQIVKGRFSLTRSGQDSWELSKT